ncbi:hypothetical protein RSSM_06712 [Rhodopirellula sallentina SM41]|uniref:Uncharacterized protein n=1 Tax=Rhodopirellula sallentina SM41 TaxID=1263870 RepID=M5U7C8_9BACT|nr:hypothetical protein RSSM_06712 [Rhodopirellula sallentina SM41]
MPERRDMINSKRGISERNSTVKAEENTISSEMTVQLRRDNGEIREE